MGHTHGGSTFEMAIVLLAIGDEKGEKRPGYLAIEANLGFMEDGDIMTKYHLNR